MVEERRGVTSVVIATRGLFSVCLHRLATSTAYDFRIFSIFVKFRNLIENPLDNEMEAISRSKLTQITFFHPIKSS